MKFPEGGTRAMLIDRQQAEIMAKDLLNSLDHPMTESVMLIMTDDVTAMEAMRGFTQGYQGKDGPMLGDLPSPEFLYLGTVFTVALPATPEQFVEGMEGRDDAPR